MPYIITTKTPPQAGAMACCRSTIGAGRCDHMIEQSRWHVATLEEAVDAVAGNLTEWCAAHLDAPYDALDAAQGRLTEQGGTVGPLPDGTLIEVERRRPSQEGRPIA